MRAWSVVFANLARAFHSTPFTARDALIPAPVSFCSSFYEVLVGSYTPIASALLGVMLRFQLFKWLVLPGTRSTERP